MSRQKQKDRGNAEGRKRGVTENEIGSGSVFPRVRDKNQSLEALTSRASRRPSPRKLSENSVRENTLPGKTSSHQNSSIFSAPSLINAPHELIGGCTPRPRKLRNASSSITAGTVRVE